MNKLFSNSSPSGRSGGAINPAFNKELEKFGSINYNACYNCGTCTAVCSLSTEEVSFPREMVRLSALGL